MSRAAFFLKNWICALPEVWAGCLSFFGGMIRFARFFGKFFLKTKKKRRAKSPGQYFKNMILDKYVSIPGLPGIHKIVSSRSNGLFIFDTIENRQRFVPVRGSNFTPLATISMYTETEEGLISLNDVFDRVKTSLETTPLPASDGNSGVFRNWFATVVPEHDKDRVHIADIKKLVKWYAYMDGKGLIAEAEKATADAAEKAAAETAETEKTAETDEKA